MRAEAGECSGSSLPSEWQSGPLLAAALLAIADTDLGGVVLAGAPGPGREAWLAAMSAANPKFRSAVRLTANVSALNLEGGADFAASLALGRPVMRQGLLDTLDGRPLLLVGAERWGAGKAARLLAACETRLMPLVLALDESCDDDAAPPSMLSERLALRVVVDGLRAADVAPSEAWCRRIAEARARLGAVVLPDDILGALVAAAVTLGITSSRADAFAVAAARAHAAWRGVLRVAEEDAEMSVRLVLAHRARRVPQSDEQQSGKDQSPETGAPEAPAPVPQHGAPATLPDAGEEAPATDLDDRLVAAAAAALPEGLLAAMRQAPGRAATALAAGSRARGTGRKARHGRPVGSAPGDPRHDGPLDLLATIAAAAPWQSLRRRMLARNHRTRSDATRRVVVLPSDVRVTRFRNHAPATTVFAVDASGSSALHRMAEAKGAIELLLAECYVRREKVAVVAFRGPRAEVLLPPTRALARARRALSGLPGGGATPLAGGIDAACALAVAARRAGEAALVVLLTDGRANIDRSGAADRRRAGADAIDAANRLAALSLPALLIDTSPVPGPKAADLARAMHARYVPLPHAGAREIAGLVERAAASSR